MVEGNIKNAQFTVLSAVRQTKCNFTYINSHPMAIRRLLFSHVKKCPPTPPIYKNAPYSKSA